MRNLAAAHQHFSVLGTAVKRRYHLAGVEQAVTVKCAFDAKHLLVFFRRELHAHGVEFFHAHPVLACHRAAHRHAGLQNIGTKQLAAVQLVSIVGIKQNQGVQVAVPCMKNIGAAQLVFFLHLGNRQQNICQALAWNGRVHAHVVGADTARCRESVFATAPKAQALGFALADRNGRGTTAGQHLAHAADFFFNFFHRAITLAEQNRLSRQVIASVYKVFNGRRHGLVHHLQPRRNDACCNHAGNRITGFAQVIKTGHDAACQLRFGNEFDSDLGGDCQHAFTADDNAEQVVACGVECVTAKLDRFTFNREAFDLEHVVYRQAIFQAMHTA